MSSKKNMNNFTRMFNGITMSYEERLWCINASSHGGGFVKAFGYACLCADPENTEILLPVIHKMMEKYPKYSDSNLYKEGT